MIFYIFNYYFQDNSGFSIRCQREIDTLSQNHDITVICRGKDKATDKNIYRSPYKKININYFYGWTKLVERPRIYIPLVYEVIRNISLFIGLSYHLIKLFSTYRGKERKIYVVCSPLTVPFIVFITGKLYHVSLEVLEFHDLEPELAIHIKKISKENLIYKIEIFLEKYLCNRYKKIIVTSFSQAERIIHRTKINKNKIFVVPNTIEGNKKINLDLVFKNKYGIKARDFVLGYITSFSFDYTIEGIIEIINNFDIFKKRIKNIKLLLIGDGDGLQKVKNIANNNPDIIFTGRVNNISNLSKIINIGIIPWKKDTMTETILPTKLFEYMLNKNVIVAPNFGEFKRVLTHMKDSLLYNSTEEFISNILLLYKNKHIYNLMKENGYRNFKNNYSKPIYEAKLKKIIDL